VAVQFIIGKTPSST